MTGVERHGVAWWVETRRHMRRRQHTAPFTCAVCAMYLEGGRHGHFVFRWFWWSRHGRTHTSRPLPAGAG